MSRLPTMQRQQGKSLAQRSEHPLMMFRREMDDLFNRFFEGWGWPIGMSEENWPRQEFWNFDVQEKDNEILLRAEMPGFEEKDLDVRLENNVLTIKAERDEKKDGEERSSRFFRSVTLPWGIDSEKVEASYHNGVLEMRMPRPEGARGKRIEVQGRRETPKAEREKNGHKSKK